MYWGGIIWWLNTVFLASLMVIKPHWRSTTMSREEKMEVSSFLETMMAFQFVTIYVVCMFYFFWPYQIRITRGEKLVVSLEDEYAFF